MYESITLTVVWLAGLEDKSFFSSFLIWLLVDYCEMDCYDKFPYVYYYYYYLLS